MERKSNTTRGRGVERKRTTIDPRIKTHTSAPAPRKRPTERREVSTTTKSKTSKTATTGVKRKPPVKKTPKSSPKKTTFGRKKLSKSENKKTIRQTFIKIGVVIGLMLLFFIIGNMIGYGVIGGKKAFDILKPSTWQHLFAFFN